MRETERDLSEYSLSKRERERDSSACTVCVCESMGKAKRVVRRQRVSQALRAKAVHQRELEKDQDDVGRGERDNQRGRSTHATTTGGGGGGGGGNHEDSDGRGGGMLMMQWSDDGDDEEEEGAAADDDEDEEDDEDGRGARRKRMPMRSAERRMRRQDSFVNRLMAERERALATVKEGGVRKRRKTLRRRRATARGDGKTLQSLDQLMDALPEMAERKKKVIDPHAAATRAGMRSGRTLSKINVQEMQRLDRVRSHPSFMENPLAAITAHLEQTLPKEPPRKAPENTNRSKRRRKKAAKDARMAVD